MVQLDMYISFQYSLDFSASVSSLLIIYRHSKRPKKSHEILSQVIKFQRAWVIISIPSDTICHYALPKISAT